MKLGLLERKESWCLTLRGWIAVIAGMVGLAFLSAHGVFPFLAPTHRIGGDFLVVEGWLPDYALADLRQEFDQGGFKLLVITGSPILKGEALTEHKNLADLTKAILLKAGWPNDKLVAVPSAEVLKDRTYAAALALKEWLDRSKTPARSLTLYSGGAHARRSWLLYRMALGSQTQVGIIASRDLRYDGKRWWRTSEGVRDILNESIAYVYAKILFLRPHQAP